MREAAREKAGRHARQGRPGASGTSQAASKASYCRAFSCTDFSVDGSSYDGQTIPGPCAVNCTNGDDFGTTPFPHPYYGSEGSGEAYAFHPGGANFAFGDGSVRLLSQEISIREFARLVTRDSGESINVQ